MILPHGGQLSPLWVSDGYRRQKRIEEASRLPKLNLSSRETGDVLLAGSGAYSPLAGFMDRGDYLGTVRDMRLASGVMWPIPITLAATRENAAGIREGQEIALADGASGCIIGCMKVVEKFRYDQRLESLQVYGTDDPAHPGVRKLLAQGDIYLGGPVEVLSEGNYPHEYPAYARPAETRAAFASRGWKTVSAFQTRNPIHRSHEYLTKIALELCDGLFLHPVTGELKAGDIPASVRIRCYQAMLDHYYPPERVLFSVCPLEMRYAGPREALLHAIVRQNYGCSHLIIGRDHAGVGHYYGTRDAQDIFGQLRPGDLLIQPLKLEHAFWCKRCESIATARTCPHSGEDILTISGTELRAMISRDIKPPKEIIRPEVADILMNHYRALKRRQESTHDDRQIQAETALDRPLQEQLG